MKKNPIPTTFSKYVDNELIPLRNNFISIYKYKRSKNLSLADSFAKIYYKYVKFQIFLLICDFDYLLPRIN